MKRIYLDFAAATPLSTRAKSAYVRALELFGNPSAPHAEGRAAREAIDLAREKIAQSVRVKAEELVITSGGTEANNIAVLGTEWNHAVTTVLEHSSVLKAFQIAERQGRSVTYVMPDEILKAVTKDTGLVSVHHVQSELGTVQPVNEIGLALKRFNKKIIFHIDAAQSPMWLDASPHTLRADLVSYDAQKVMGPKGVGILYRNFDVALRPPFGGGTQERGIRPGTENTPAIVAAGVAFEEAAKGRRERTKKVTALREYLIQNILEVIPEAHILGSRKRRVANNVFVAIPGADGDYLAVLLDREGIALTPRSACLGSGGALSEAALAVTGDPDLARGTIRFSLGPSTLKSDLDRAIRALTKVLPLALSKA